MPYIGRSTDGFGVRNRFLYLASADDTSVSGADANGATLSFSDGAYVDVYLNGVLLKAGTDYNTNTANTIAGLSAMAANDEVTVIVYDVFTVGDMVSATSGGTFVGNVAMSGTLGVTGATTTAAITASGVVDITDTTDASDATGDTGALRTEGGASIAKKLYVGTDLDVDGTANLDVVDIDGAVDMASTLAVGSDVTIRNSSSTGPSLNIGTTSTSVADGGYIGGILFTAGSSNTATARIQALASGTSEDGADFSFECRDSGASFTEKVRFTGDGKVGISTTSPDAKLDVEGTTDAEMRVTRTTATTSSTFNDAGSVLNLVNNVNYENGYNGGASIGQILFTSNDSSTGAGVRAKISCKATTYYHAEDLQFFVSPSNTGTGQVSATSQTDGLRMNIAPTGKTSFFADLNSNSGMFQNSNSSPYGLSIYFSGASPSNTTNWFLSCADNASQNFIVFSNGDAKNDNGVYTTFSDERLKSNIVDAKSQWEDIKALKFKNFTKFSNPDLKQLGLVAQDVEKTSPNLVFETPPNKFEIKHNSAFGTLYEEGDKLPEGKEVGDVKEIKSNVKNVKDSILYMKAVKALQEAMARIETLEAKVKALEEA